MLYHHPCPKVSVAIITFNQKELLREAIETVLSQDYPNLEIIVADDGSQDGTQEMLCEYESRYPDLFKLALAHENGGITANSNRALWAATGEYIAWLGGDDLMLPGKLAKQVAVLEADKTLSTCVHAMDVFRSSTGETIRIQHPTPNGLLRYGAAEIVRFMNCIIMSSAMMRRSMCPEHGYDTRLPVVSDFLYLVEAATQGPVAVIPEVLGRYRRHAVNWTQRGFIHHIDISLTLQIVENKYPWLIPAVNHARYTLNSARGVEFVLSNDLTTARQLLVNSLRYRLRLYPLAWLMVTAAPAPLRERAKQFWCKRTGAYYQK